MNKSNNNSKNDGIKIKGYFYFIIFLLLIIADRLTKIWAMNLKQSIDYEIFSFSYITNTGAGFSILQNMNVMLIWISVIILGLLVFFYDKIPKVSFMLIISGLIGNLIDRISFGRVIDFIDFKFWPVFNIADSLIVIGAIWMIIVVIREDHIASKKKKNNKIKRRKTKKSRK